MRIVELEPSRIDPSQSITQYDPFANNVKLGQNQIICGDARGPDGAFIRVLGGAVTLTYQAMLMQETLKPGSVTSSIEDFISRYTPVFIEDGIKLSAHSDTRSDPEGKLDVQLRSGSIGCALAQNLSNISRTAANQPKKHTERSMQENPQLFKEDPLLKIFAQEYLEALGRLANRSGVIGSGREMVISAVQSGAEARVYSGLPITSNGVANYEPGSSIDVKKSKLHGSPVYVDDSWAQIELFDKYSEMYPVKPNQRRVAVSIFTNAIFDALKVENRFKRLA